MTLSNLLSFSRILLAIPIVYLLSFNTFPYNLGAFLLTLVAVATDYLDGKIARRFGTVSTVGKFLDPIADKLLMGFVAAYLAFYRGNMPGWFAILIIAKDSLILIGGSALFAKRIVSQAEGPGKYTVAVLSFVLICFIFDLNQIGTWAIIPAILFALYSTWFYYLKFLKLLERQAGPFLRFVLPAILVALAIAVLIQAMFSPLSM